MFLLDLEHILDEELERSQLLLGIQQLHVHRLVQQLQHPSQAPVDSGVYILHFTPEHMTAQA